MRRDNHGRFRCRALVAVFAVVLSGCGTMANGRGWGQDATLAPGWARVGEAALKAATAPETWVPAAGALAFQVGRADRHLEQWAVEKTPVFGSQQNADHMSDYLLEASGAIWVASGVATPSGNESGDWIMAKIKGFSVQTGAGILMRETVGFLKQNIGRTRPGGGGNDSFPSGHASGAAIFSTLASRNIETLGWSQAATTASQLGLGALTVATAWARVEANYHFPSDVLTSIAIGHYFGAFFTDAFLGIDNPRHAAVLLEPSREGVIALVRFDF
ncbi:MAG: phosphatase PAP2 family protein [Betaproteobacteria bacterium]